MGGPLVAAADEPRSTGAVDAVPPSGDGCGVRCDRSARYDLPLRPLAGERAGVSNCEVERGSPVLGRAQGGRLAPPPSAAAALTPSAHRADWLSCGRRRAATAPGGARSCEDAGG